MVELGGFQLRTSGEAGGRVVQNGGTLIVTSFNMDGIVADFEFKSHIGDQGSLDSSWVMSNDSVLLLDNPLEGAGLGWDGENGYDLEVGAGTGEAVGRLELHVFDVYEFESPDLGNATVAGSVNGPQ